MGFKSILTGGAIALLASTVGNAATVVNFDDLTGSGVVADGYGGIVWGGAWHYYDAPNDNTFTPTSGLERVYTEYALNQSGVLADVAFKFAAPVQFDGASFAGGVYPGVTFNLYLAGALVGTSATLTQTIVPAFLASGYGGDVDEVRVTGYSGYYAMDDVTYRPGVGGAVPEPATWALMIVGFGMAGMGLRRRGAARTV